MNKKIQSRTQPSEKQKNAGMIGVIGIGVAWLLGVGGLVFLSYSISPSFLSVAYDPEPDQFVSGGDSKQDEQSAVRQDAVEHHETPEAVKAVYMTTCAAATPSFRTHLIGLIEDTELNSIVIDIKDYSGNIGFDVKDPELEKAEGLTCFVSDMKEFVQELHDRDIYVIGRITVFQDPFYAPRHPSIAVQRESDGGIWRDKKGLAYIDPGAKQAWDYTVTLAQESYELGFDELNFDYIRFPSDGNMRDIQFPVSGLRAKEVVLEEFFAYLHERMSDPELFSGDTPVTSADLFGMVTTNYDHLGIGQVLERALPYFDYIAPMVYPSHYPNGFHGLSNPNHYPHEVIEYSMSRAVARTVATTTSVNHIGAERIGTSTPAIYTKESYNKNKLRPWLQDFDYGGNYGPQEVRTQIQATYDSGLNNWMLWDPGNQYTRGALESAQ